MALEKMVDEVLGQANNQAGKILAEAKAESSKIISEAESKADLFKKNFREKTKNLTVELEKREISAFKLRLNKSFFEAKREILNEVSSKAFEKISSINGEKRNNFLKQLASIAFDELENAEFFYCNEKDKVFLVKVFSKQTFAGTISTIGGFVLENSSKDIKVNYTFEVLFDSIKGEFLNEVSSRIF